MKKGSRSKNFANVSTMEAVPKSKKMSQEIQNNSISQLVEDSKQVEMQMRNMTQQHERCTKVKIMRLKSAGYPDKGKYKSMFRWPQNVRSRSTKSTNLSSEEVFFLQSS